MGIDVGSKKLGMVYIFCRPTSIYTLNLSDKVASKHLTKISQYLRNFIVRISDPKYSARSPIVSRDGCKIAYLINSLGRSHFKASQLAVYDLGTKCERVVVDIVKDPKTDFPGLFCQRLPVQSFTDKIYLTTCWFDQRVN